MERHAFSMGPSGGFSGSKHRLKGSNSNSTGISSSRGNRSDGAQGTGRAPKKRKARSKWSKEQTQQLLNACLELKGRLRMRAVPLKWQSISVSVNGKNAEECRRRMETLTKFVKEIEEYGAVCDKQISQQTEEDFRSLKLATKMKLNWYYQLCEIRMQAPQNAMVVPSPDSGDPRMTSSPSPAPVMVRSGQWLDSFSPLFCGDEGEGCGLGTPERAWAAGDPPRSTSPTDLQSHNGAAPGFPPLADSPCHSHQLVNPIKQRIATAADAHLPPVDLRNGRTAVDAGYVPSQTDVWRPQGLNDLSPQHPSHQVLRDTGHDSDARTHFDPDVEGLSDIEESFTAETGDYEVRLWGDAFYA